MDSHFLVSSFTLLPSRLHSALMLLLLRFGTQSMQISLPLTPLPTRRRYTRYIYKFIKFRSISNKRSTVSIDTFTSTERETMLKVLFFFQLEHCCFFAFLFIFLFIICVFVSLPSFIVCTSGRFHPSACHRKKYSIFITITTVWLSKTFHIHTHMLR